MGDIKFTEEQRLQIKDMLHKGQSVREIADHFKADPSTIYYYRKMVKNARTVIRRPAKPALPTKGHVVLTAAPKTQEKQLVALVGSPAQIREYLGGH